MIIIVCVQSYLYNNYIMYKLCGDSVDSHLSFYSYSVVYVSCNSNHAIYLKNINKIYEKQMYIHFYTTRKYFRHYLSGIVKKISTKIYLFHSFKHVTGLLT